MPKRINLDTNRIINLYKQGIAPKEIAETIGISQSTVYKRLTEANIDMNQFFNFEKDGNKKCRKCQETKPSESFYIVNDCLSYRCKECDKKYGKMRNKRDRKKRAIKNRQWREKNKGYVKKKNKEWKENNKEWLKQYNQRPDVKKRRRETSREWRRNEIKNNPSFKVAAKMRNRIRMAIKRQSATKKNKSIDLIGCSIKFLIDYLESKWLPGMTWDNYSMYGWHIDHIKPCSSFDLTQESEQFKCFHYTNLQPLWWRDNLSKNGKILD